MPTSPTITSILELPYSRRRFIYVSDNVEILPAREKSRLVDGAKRFAKYFTLATGSAGALGASTAILAPAVIPVLPTVATAAGLGVALVWAYRFIMNDEHIDILHASRSLVSNVIFPIGHPIPNTVYVGHPGIPTRYFPLCDFHKALFADKYAEAVRLLRTLGAKEVEISYVSGWSEKWAASIGLHIPLMSFSNSSIGAGAKHSSKEDMQIIGRWEFRESNEAPRIPLDMVWYKDEPNWMEVANGRLEGRLSAFKLNLSYSKDFSVNSKLKATIEKCGLDLGGEFSDFEATTWKMSGSFPPLRL
jgi:hypothetical protein